MNTTISNLEFLQSTSDKTCQYLSGKEINIIQFFCLGLLRRIDDTTSSTKILFTQLKENHKLEFTIGIMFRALVLDTLISMNLFKLIKDLEAQSKTDEEIETAVKEFCNEALSDGLRTTLAYIKDAETYGMKTAQETAETFKNMGHVFKPFFDNYPGDGTKPNLKYKKNHNGKQLFEALAKTTDLKEISKIYDGYAYLSKYDHFGIIYYHAINEKLETKLEIYKSMSETFVAHNALIHVLLARYSKNDNFINEQSLHTNDYLLKNIINQNNS